MGRQVLKHLIDKSALARAGHVAVGRRLRELRATTCTCTVTDLEVLFSARSLDDWDSLRSAQRRMLHLPITDTNLDRAVEVQRGLAARGLHRGPSVVDLVIAAVAEEHGAIVVHYDKHFATIAEATGQPTEWVVPAGTLP